MRLVVATLILLCAPAVSAQVTQHPMTVNTPVTLAGGTVGSSYSATLTTSVGLSGGVSPFTCTLTSGALPAGLTLNSNCTITGTPTASGNFNFGYSIRDSSPAAPLNFRGNPATRPNGLAMFARKLIHAAFVQPTNAVRATFLGR